MAYTNSPESSTYKTIPISVDGRVLFRSGDTSNERDLQIVNMYFDTVFQDSQNKSAIKRLKKRPGLAATSYSLTKAASSDVLRGHYYDNDQNAFYWAVNNKVYAVLPDVGVSTRTVATLNTSSGLVGFCSYLKSDNTRLIAISDGTDLWLDDFVAVSCTRVTDVDLPTPHQPCPIYINGYIFLIKADTGDIYNSVVDDPTDWTPGDFMTAEISSDYTLRLVKARNYIVALGKNSIEYFYDGGVASGSPLTRNDSPYRSIGYITNLCEIGDVTYFIGQDEKGNVGVYVIENFDVKKVSNSVVDRTLQTYSSTANDKSNAVLDKTGNTVSLDGHTFYIIPTETTTWVFDVEEKEWYEWKNSDGTKLDIEASWAMYNGSMYVAIAGQTTVSIMNSSIFQDFGSNYTCRYTSEFVDGGTLNWKYLNRITLDCSQEAASGTSNVTLTWSDKDWIAAAGASRTVNVFSISPQIFRLGRFRKRSFRFEYADNYPFWLQGFHLDINVGQI